MTGDGEQTALDEYAGDDHGEDDLDALRNDVDQLTAMVDTLVGAHQDLADTVGELVGTDDGRDAPTDTTDAVEDHADEPRGFQ